MNNNGDNSPLVRYTVAESDKGQAEREAAFLNLLARIGPEYAAQWHKGLLANIAQLAQFPGPLSHSIDEAATARYGFEIRRALYTGPGKRSSRMTYRILFAIFPSLDDGAMEIRVLRLLHGAQSLDEEVE